jgi:dolichol kinase
MSNSDVISNVSLVLLCYAYVVLVIFISGKLPQLVRTSSKASRKFLHAMIGNLVFVIPFFTWSIYPAMVAAPFILVTFLASPHSPYQGIYKRLKGLADITEKGHSLGLVFYAISYTFLALLFASKPMVIASGILPMAYGDSLASLVGERYGRVRYKIFAQKSLVGSTAMFLASFISLAASLAFFSALYSFSVYEKLVPAFVTTLVATLIEAFSPMGFDNLSVPAFSAAVFLLSGGA